MGLGLVLWQIAGNDAGAQGVGIGVHEGVERERAKKFKWAWLRERERGVLLSKPQHWFQIKLMFDVSGCS